MKSLKFIAIAIGLTTLMSCGGSMNEQPVNAEAFKVIETEVKGEFGDNAYYTELSIGYDEEIGVWISTTVTDKPESLQMGEWSMSQNTWKQTSEVTLEVPEGSEAADFMFQLNEEINLTKLGELVEESITKLKADKNIESPALSLAYVKFPDNGDVSKAEYVVQLEPVNGGTSFSYSYKLDGELVKLNY